MEIDKIKEKLNSHLNDLEKIIMNNYLVELEKNNFRVSNYEYFCPALYYLIKRKAKVPQVISEVCRKFEVPFGCMNSQFKKIKRFLKLKSCDNHSIIKTQCLMISKPSQFLPRFIEKLDISEKEKIKLTEKCTIIGRQTWKSLNTRAVNGYCAGLIYYIIKEYDICNKKLSQREIADICGCTEVTIKIISNELKSMLISKEGRALASL
jgi:transcription initiation factor TFIIIB Brf1 subunit/transcription initiation factor TFIIB